MIIIKSKNEIELMKKSGEIVAKALEITEKEICPDLTTKELDRLIDEYIRKNGGIPSFKGYKSSIPRVESFPASICASINNEVIHGIPNSKRLKNGDIISIDIGVFLNGYHADAARTFPVGKISEKSKRLIEITKESFYRGIQEAIEGKRISNISSNIQDFVENNGFSIVREFVGHGIGKNIHELPQIPNYKTKEKGARLTSGMTLAIEPMVNEGGYDVEIADNNWTVVTADGGLSAHYENTIAVTKGEPIILTSLN